ncbi:MAG: transposase [Deltaproteobacteria bacterium]|nr:transposase [Deltaproteobacteria bacterium]
MWATVNIFSISTAEVFIAAIMQHIPDPGFQMVRYVGGTQTGYEKT